MIINFNPDTKKVSSIEGSGIKLVQTDVSKQPTSIISDKIPKCHYCYDKGTYSVALGGSETLGDFTGDPKYIIPFSIENRPCPRCQNADRLRIIELVRQNYMNGNSKNSSDLAELESKILNPKI